MILLADFLKDPAQANTITPDQIPAILSQLAALQSVLASRLLASGLASTSNIRDGDDHLLDVGEAAKLLVVSEDWIYRHAKQLPFTRKLWHKMLRFSYQGIQKWLAKRNLSLPSF